MNNKNILIAQFLNQVAANNPNEPEFLQAVKEVAETLLLSLLLVILIFEKLIVFDKKIQNTIIRCYLKEW